MAIAVAMRAASYDIRVPDGALSIYGCMLVRYTPSPSRILSLMDALLPMGILGQCLAGKGCGFLCTSNISDLKLLPLKIISKLYVFFA